MLSQLRKEQRLIEDWSSPLITREYAHGPLPPFEHAAELVRNGECAPTAPKLQQRCLISTSVLDTGGIDEFVAFLSRRLPSHGIATTIMLTDPAARRGLLLRSVREEGIQVIQESVENSRRWLTDNRPDVISAHAPPDWLIEAAHDARIPVVETLHAVPTPIGTNWQAEARRSQCIRFFVAVSELVRLQYMRGNPAFQPDAIVTIPNGFNDRQRPPVDRTAARQWLGLEDEFLFVSLGRHVLQKNAYGLISAFSAVAQTFRHAHLLIAGRMDDALYMQQLLRLRGRSGASDRIHLRDSISHPSILLCAADCFVLNSFFEGWPLASMEALCAGLPVIMSDVGGAREQVGREGKFGYIVANPAGDPETVTWETAARHRFQTQRNRAELVSAMNDIIDNREHWEAERSVIAREARIRFDVEACIKQYVNVLGKAAAA
ncbi:glycosyltransferase family 4 protein [Bradyrhizobium sp. LMG 9283]|uniref:glycosyltransferase family 4 protein n=1 Tax=Bradyrhizobium sp. LMG 9283 TaxID=592064 RepID=UPI00388E8606